MNCLLLAATAKEVAPFIEHFRPSQKKMFPKFNLEILVSGIGLTATSYQLSRHLAYNKPDLIVQAGVAGCFDQKVALGSVFFVQTDIIADQVVMEADELKDIFDLGLAKPNQPPYKQKQLKNPKNEIAKKIKLKSAKAVSVNQISTNKRVIDLYRKKFNPLLESMEGAALHYVCLMENISFIQIRSVSNYIGERNKKNWNMDAAVKSLNQTLIQLFDHL